MQVSFSIMSVHPAKILNYDILSGDKAENRTLAAVATAAASSYAASGALIRDEYTSKFV